MSATCDMCRKWGADDAFSGVTLCPLHAEAEAMRNVLAGAFTPLEDGGVFGPIEAALHWMGDRQAQGEYSGQWRYNAYDGLEEWIRRARPILARIEGKADGA